MKSLTHKLLIEVSPDVYGTVPETVWKPLEGVSITNASPGDVIVNGRVLEPLQTIWWCHWCRNTNVIGLHNCETCGMVRT